MRAAGDTGYMGYSEYTGRSPGGVQNSGVVDRISQHRRWDIDSPSEDECANCGTPLALQERHLLVTLSDNRSRSGVRRHLCGEECLHEWMSDDEQPSD
jgi:hypothetical protein